jgi:alpha-D-xyloside xylohydrolase
MLQSARLDKGDLQDMKSGKKGIRSSVLILLSMLILVAAVLFTALQSASWSSPATQSLSLSSKHLSKALECGGFYYETEAGRISLPVQLEAKKQGTKSEWQAKTSDGRTASLAVIPDGDNYALRLSAQPAEGIIKWGFHIISEKDEYFTGLMERVVDGPQQASWAPGLKEAMNLRGQKVEMLVKPTTSVYAPFYLSSRGYGLFIKTDWPGLYDFGASVPEQVKVEFEGPSLDVKIYTAAQPAAIVSAHALDAGPPFLPPKWTYRPWRWRDEHTQRTTYYDGTPVTGPFNSEMMEDVLMMRAFGIPCGVYWIDRPWGPGRLGYDDFEIDPQRLPNFAESVKYLNTHQMQMVLWIASFFQGRMEKEAQEKGYTLAGQKPSVQNYPLVDLSNPAAKAYWQAGIEKLLKLGVAGFKLDRGEEQIPDGGTFKRFDGKSIRENRNPYVAMFAQAVAEVVRKYRGDDFVAMPRGAYTGSSPYAVFWGGDIGGTQWGLRASIIAVQRAAVMGYPNWGSDTCGYNEQTLDQDMCARWLAFSCFTPIMEVGPTRNVAFWNLPREPNYDSVLIAAWRLYARLHDRLADYTYAQAQEATRTGLPIVRPLFLVEPKAPAAWSNWWTYLYGRDLLVSPVWEKDKRNQEVYLPSGSRWRDAWSGKTYDGGRTVTIKAELHQMPLFVREGSKVELGDLNKEWQESTEIASRKPDLKALEAEVNAWFKKQQ